jgi:hypothetical protein
LIPDLQLIGLLPIPESQQQQQQWILELPLPNLHHLQ